MEGDYILIDRNKLDLLLQSVAELKEQVMSGTQGPARKDWMTVKEFLKYYDICDNTWRNRYKDKIIWRDDGTIIRIYAPSMDKYLMEKAINK